MSRLLGDITQPNVESRYMNLLVELEMVIDSSVHTDEKILRGTLMGKMVNGKFRAYAEANVAVGGDFSTAADTFTLENGVGQASMKHLRVGDTIQSASGTALGVIATFNAETGVGTLVANSANNLAAGEAVNVVPAELSIAKVDARILKSETVVEGSLDVAEPGYNEGFFVTPRVMGATAAALTAMGAKVLSSTEFRMI